MYKNFLDLYFKPKQAWEELAKEHFTIRDLYLKAVVIFAFIPAVSHFLGFTLFKNMYIAAINEFLKMAEQDKDQPQRTIEYMKSLKQALLDNDLTKELSIMIVTYGFELFKPVVLAIIIMFLSPAFKGIKDPAKSFTVAIFALVPSWAAGAFYVVNSPITMFMLFLGTFYTFYLVFIGAEKILKIPSEESKNFQFIIVVIILYLIISGIIGQIEAGLTYKILLL
ncbi:YIP1 family protein [Persephonella sp.]